MLHGTDIKNEMDNLQTMNLLYLLIFIISCVYSIIGSCFTCYAGKSSIDNNYKVTYLLISTCFSTIFEVIYVGLE